jgi:hypothetical protein
MCVVVVVVVVALRNVWSSPPPKGGSGTCDWPTHLYGVFVGGWCLWTTGQRAVSMRKRYRHRCLRLCHLALGQRVTVSMYRHAPLWTGLPSTFGSPSL